MKNRGFTFLELMVIIAIIGIIASLSVGSFRRLIMRYNVESQIQEIYADIMNLRLNATHRNRTCFILLSQYSYKGYEDSYPSPFGNDELDEAQDNLIFSEKTVKFPLSYSSGNVIAIDARGFSTTNKTVCIFSNVDPRYDCIKISRTRVVMGKIKNLSGECKSENCEEK